VLGDPITRAPATDPTRAALPRTGVETSVLLTLAGIFLIVGSSLAVGSRVRRRRLLG
jgi:LPXTG-motif cell wall-anchored protein